MHIKRSEQVPSLVTPPAEVVYELVGHVVGGGARHSVAQIVLMAGKRSRRHYHPDAEESYTVLAGMGRVVVDTESKRVQPGDVVAIPVGATHQIINDGVEPLVFLAVCAPPWTPDNSVYVD